MYLSEPITTFGCIVANMIILKIPLMTEQSTSCSHMSIVINIDKICMIQIHPYIVTYEHILTHVATDSPEQPRTQFARTEWSQYRPVHHLLQPLAVDIPKELFNHSPKANITILFFRVVEA